MPSDYERAAAYIDAIPPPNEGSRNDGLNRAAYALRERFVGLGETDFALLLNDWASRMIPPLPMAEIETTIRSAWRGAQNKGTVGTKATPSRGPGSSAPRPRPVSTRPPTEERKELPAPSAKKYDLFETDLPEPIENGAVELIRSAFGTQEGVCIAQGQIGEDGREHPKDEGAVFTAQAWVEMMQKRGGPTRMWTSSKGAGVFIRINPMTPGGAKDSDVLAYRHALLEIDVGLSVESQHALWVASGIPCAAIIASGGKSIHAWVKVDAKDRREYEERVSFLHAHFAAYGIDTKNKNPSRFSRLPDVRRGNRRQELLALRTGAESWSEWVKKLDGDSLGPARKISDLLTLDTTSDPNCVIGFRDGRTLRYLCRGKSAWLLGPSGIGKSSLVTEFAVGWALGQPVWGITPARPLRSLIVQAENDEHDLAEMAQGIANAYDLTTTPEALQKVSDNVLFRSETRSVGEAFVARLQRMLDHDRPDIVWIDPLLSFAGIDVSKQDQVTAFLRTQLNPVLESTGAVAIGVHHTGKPKGEKETKNWTAIDWAYSGLGSSELVNWARAVMLLRPIGSGAFQLMLAKRGRRAGAAHPDGEPTTNLFLRHASHGIRWEQTLPPQEPHQDGVGAILMRKEGQDSGRGEKRAQAPSKAESYAALAWLEVTSKLPTTGVSGRDLHKRASAWLAKTARSISKATFLDALAPKLVEQHRLGFDGELYFPPSSTPPADGGQ